MSASIIYRTRSGEFIEHTFSAKDVDERDEYVRSFLSHPANSITGYIYGWTNAEELDYYR